MCPDGVSPISMIFAIAGIITYMYGDHAETRYTEALKNIGLTTVGFVLLYNAFGNCPIVIIQMAIPLLIATLLAKAVFWAVFKYVVK